MNVWTISKRERRRAKSEIFEPVVSHTAAWLIRAEFHPPPDKTPGRATCLVYNSWNFHYVINNYYCRRLEPCVTFRDLPCYFSRAKVSQRSAKVSARLKQLVTYVPGTCGGDKVSEFARRLHVAIYKVGRHLTNRRLRIIAFLSTVFFFPSF